MAIYTCEQCLFCFERKGEINACPDCGRMSIRNATEDEISEYNNNRIESEQLNAQKAKADLG